MANDPRLGTRNGSGVITEYPAQFSDGTTFELRVYPSPTIVNLTSTAFAVLKPGVALLSDALRVTLTNLAGGSASASSYTQLLSNQGIAAIENEVFFDDFVGGTLDSTLWASDENGTGAAVTLPATVGFTVVQLATGADDEAHATLSSTAFNINSSSTLSLIETRLRVNAVTDAIIEFGFSDASSETDGVAFTSHDATPVAVASNVAVLGFNHTTSGETGTEWFALSNRATSNVAYVDTNTALSANTFVELTVALSYAASQVNASFFVNGARVATISNAIAANTTLYPWVTVKTKAAATARTLQVDYLRVSTSR